MFERTRTQCVSAVGCALECARSPCVALAACIGKAHGPEEDDILAIDGSE